MTTKNTIPDFSKAKPGDDVFDIDFMAWGKIEKIVNKKYEPFNMIVRFPDGQRLDYDKHGFRRHGDLCFPLLYWDKWAPTPPEAAITPPKQKETWWFFIFPVDDTRIKWRASFFFPTKDECEEFMTREETALARGPYPIEIETK